MSSSYAPYTPPPEAGAGLANLLRVFGWLSLLGGIFGAFWWYSKFGTVEIPSATLYDFTPERVSNPAAVWVAAALASNGAFWWATCSGLAVALEHLIALRRVATPSAAPVAPVPPSDGPPPLRKFDY